ncbi:DUF975 family protein [Alloiococcus sp. CFN-8]|uniref:DUF975 family protein n=1 Tax=Alloiococcus sp. CFN-8 TaxID=3416081 RepID=UPI003CE68F7E
MFASDFRRRAREVLSGRWALAIGVSIIAVILGTDARANEVITRRIQEGEDGYFSFFDLLSFIGLEGTPFYNSMLSIALFWFLVIFIVGGAIKLGNCKFNINLNRNAGAEFDDLFSCFNIFGKAFLLRLLTEIYEFLWTLLLVIPGIIAYYRYAMAPYIMAEDTSLTASEAIAKSKEMMLGNKWRLFCLDISFIGWGLLAVILTLGIGLLWLNPYMEASRAAFYIELRGDNGEEQGIEGTELT